MAFDGAGSAVYPGGAGYMIMAAWERGGALLPGSDAKSLFCAVLRIFKTETFLEKG